MPFTENTNWRDEEVWVEGGEEENVHEFRFRHVEFEEAGGYPRAIGCHSGTQAGGFCVKRVVSIKMVAKPVYMRDLTGKTV